jgi:GntR family transcriptional regulator
MRKAQVKPRTPVRTRTDPRDGHDLDSRILLSGTSGTPVYLQLANQLKYLIVTGDLAVGDRLPSARHLADNVSINRNTVLSAYAILRRDGYVAANHGGGTIVLSSSDIPDPYREAALRPEVLALIDQVVARASDLGILPGELASLVASHAGTRSQRSPLTVAFVECNRQSLGHFVDPIQREFDVAVRPVLIEDMTSAVRRGELRDIDCVVTTFYHFAAVRRLLSQASVSSEIFAIGARPHVSIVEALERLPRPSTFGVVYFGHEGDGSAAERVRRMAEAIEQTNIAGLRVRPLLLPERPEPALFSGIDAVVVRSENLTAARRVIPSGLAVIEFINDLDNASRRFLRDVFDDLRAKKRKDVGSRLPAAAPA